MGEFERKEFLELGFDDVSFDEAFSRLQARSAADRFEYVVTPNVDHVVRLHNRDPADAAWSAYRNAWMSLCDSRVLARLAALRNTRLPVTPGSDLTARLLENGLGQGDRLCLIGGDAAVVSDLRQRWPGQVWLHHEPPMGVLDNPEALQRACEFVVEANARFTLLAIGSPQQELLADRVRSTGSAGGTGLCVGASVEFVTGRKSRAPRWMQRASLEWLFRLLAEPRRLWRRYLLEGPRIIALTLRSKR